jgi:hypothetical protein
MRNKNRSEDNANNVSTVFTKCSLVKRFAFIYLSNPAKRLPWKALYVFSHVYLSYLL